MKPLKTKTQKQGLTLLFVAIINLAIFLIVGYITEWHRVFTSIEQSLYPEIRLLHERASYLLLVPLITSAIWIISMNGRRSFLKTSLTLILLVIPFSIIVFLIGYISHTLTLIFVLNDLNNSISEVLIVCLFFILVTTFFNWIIAKLEKVKLSMKSIIILATSQFAMPLICFFWCIFLSIFTDNPFAENGIINGGALLSITIFEGAYYIWLKNKSLYN